MDELGFDAVVDHKAADFKQQLKAATPDGVHVNFENVGGEVMRAVLSRMVIGGRVALCGLVSGYNSGEKPSDDFSPFIMARFDALSTGLALTVRLTRHSRKIGVYSSPASTPNSYPRASCKASRRAHPNGSTSITCC